MERVFEEEHVVEYTGGKFQTDVNSDNRAILNIKLMRQNIILFYCLKFTTCTFIVDSIV